MPPPGIDHVRIVVCGDAGVGKTSVLKTLISEEFDPNPPAVMSPIHVPAEVTPDKVEVFFIDTPAPDAGAATLPPGVAKLDDELARAHVVVLVFDALRLGTLERVSAFWMPKLANLAPGVPVVLAGNKVDKPEEGGEDGGGGAGGGAGGGVGGVVAPGDAVLDAAIRPVLRRHSEIDSVILCSAKDASNLGEIFYFAQKAVLNPIAPLYDAATKELKPRAKKALQHIFRICDEDHDGKLNDLELNTFQKRCFGQDLKPDELSGVKAVVREGCQDGMSADDALRPAGFVFLHKLFVERGRVETTWTVIRKFKFDNDLLLHPDLVNTHVKKHSDQAVVLSEEGVAFLRMCFDMFDTDHDGYLKPEDQVKLLEPCPINPWNGPTKLVAEDNQGLDFKAFLAKWTMCLLDRAGDALLGMTYVGYGGDPQRLVETTKRRRNERSIISRPVLKCCVLGAAGAGKTEIVRGLVGRGFADQKRVDGVIMAAKHMAVDEAYGGGERTLVLSKLPDDDVARWIASKENIESCDVACIVYDTSNPESFSSAASLLERLWQTRPTLPCVFVATKSDVSPTPDQAFEQTPAEFCKAKGLTSPVEVSVKDGELGSLYDDLLLVAIDPSVACPAYAEYVATRGAGSKAAMAVKVVAGLAVVAAAAYGAKKLYDYYKGTTQPHSM